MIIYILDIVTNNKLDLLLFDQILGRSIEFIPCLEVEDLRSFWFAISDPKFSWFIISV